MPRELKIGVTMIFVAVLRPAHLQAQNVKITRYDGRCPSPGFPPAWERWKGESTSSRRFALFGFEPRNL